MLRAHLLLHCTAALAREREEREAKFLQQQKEAIAKAASRHKSQSKDQDDKMETGGGISLIMAARMKREGSSFHLWIK